jgi:hypothetical protein
MKEKDTRIVIGAIFKGKPEIAQLVGRITGEWAAIDAALEVYLAGLIDTNYRTAHALLKPIRNSSSKREMLVNMIKLRFTESDLRKSVVSQLTTDLRTFATERNELVHGLVADDDAADKLTTVKLSDSLPFFTETVKDKTELVSYLDRLARFFHSLCNDLDALFKGRSDHVTDQKT